jgi:hypothetical protein
MQNDIKKRLQKYTELLTEIEIEERRLKALQDNGTINYRLARAGIDDNLKKLLDNEQTEYEALTGMINALPSVEERQVMLARYMDGQDWRTITRAVFGSLPDFEEKEESYLRRIHRIHGRALVDINKIKF